MKQELIDRVKNLYQEKFGNDFILIGSPGRINLIGEHTDYNEGFVFPAAIDKGIVSAIGKSDSGKCHLFSADFEIPFEFSTKEVKPLPNGEWRNYVLGVVGELEKKGIQVPAFNFVFAGDIPQGAGLSSSAALENSVVFGLNELFNLGLSKRDMIFISQKAEHNYVGVRCGIMDQYASMFGEENKAVLLDCRTLESKLFPLEFENHQLVLINTNVSHKLVEAEYNDRRDVCEKVASLLKVGFLRDASEASLMTIKNLLTEEEYQKALYIIQENERVLMAGKALNDGNIEEFGKLLFKAHLGAQHQFKISCVELDYLVEEARQNPNIIGSRMMGGGFGGCTINIVKKESVKQFTEDIAKAYKNKFDRNCSIYFVKISQGTHLIKN